MRTGAISISPLPGIGTPLLAHDIARSFKALLANPMLPDKRSHHLRHTYATLLFGVWINPMVVSAVWGTYDHGEYTGGIQPHVARYANRMLPKQWRWEAQGQTDMFCWQSGAEQTGKANEQTGASGHGTGRETRSQRWDLNPRPAVYEKTGTAFVVVQR
jgi:hypothetical protein